MIEKAIENWLINTNETNYRVPFFQLLLNKYELVKNTHGPLEDGKDIVAKDADGKYIAFQLKSGDINTTEWRKIKSQIDELIELDIRHPSFESRRPDETYLVINGSVDTYANAKIKSYNKSMADRGFNKLKIIDKDELLQIFKEAQGKFTPDEYDDFYLFLDILTSDGSDLLPKEKIIDFLNKLIFSKKFTRESDRINAISSSLIIVSYLLDPFQNKNNYFAIFEAWTCLGALILNFSYKSKIKSEKWKESMELIISEIERNLILLKNETLHKKEFFEGSIAGETRTVYDSRALMVLGTLSVLEICLSCSDEDYHLDDELIKLIKENKDNLYFWGESAFPYVFSIIKYLEREGEKNTSIYLLKGIFNILIERNQPRKQFGLPDLYCDVKNVLEGLLRFDFDLKRYEYIILDILEIDSSKGFKEVYPEIMSVGRIRPGRTEKIMDEILHNSHLLKIDFKDFNGSSFILESLILMLTRRNKKDLLTKKWREISYIRMETFYCDNKEDIYSWRTFNGKFHDELPKSPQKWGDLVTKSKTIDTDMMYLENSLFMLFLILVFPHRANTTIINFLDDQF